MRGTGDLVLGARGGPGRPWRARIGTTICVCLINRLWRTRYADLGPFCATEFRLGVACRARYDSLLRQPGDFRKAVEHWERALALDATSTSGAGAFSSTPPDRTNRIRSTTGSLKRVRT
jgi:hypothetical protein